eukprot:408977-Hanusia_phi.AAC.1
MEEVRLEDGGRRRTSRLARHFTSNNRHRAVGIAPAGPVCGVRSAKDAAVGAAPAEGCHQVMF